MELENLYSEKWTGKLYSETDMRFKIRCFDTDLKFNIQKTQSDMMGRGATRLARTRRQLERKNYANNLAWEIRLAVRG